LTSVSSTLDVEVSVIFKDSSLGNVLLVTGCLLLGFGLTDLGVLGSGKTVGNVRLGSDGSDLEL
jgi:hypothetical protein